MGRQRTRSEKIALGAGFFLLVLSIAIAGAAESAPIAGKTKAQACATCHGPFGISQLPNAPHLAGQPKIYLVEQLRAYKSGKRSNEVMSVVARGLSENDIDDLAAWYASMEISVNVKP
jgi:cytochrome c553